MQCINIVHPRNAGLLLAPQGFGEAAPTRGASVPASSHSGLASRFVVFCLYGLAFVIAATGCGAATERGQSSAAVSVSCPTEGSRVPLLQIASEAERLVGCVLESEVAFVGVSPLESASRPWHEQRGLVSPGEALFSVSPPGHPVNEHTLAAYNIAVDRNAAGPFYEAPSGAVFKVVGKPRHAVFALGAARQSFWVLGVTSFERVTDTEAPQGETESVSVPGVDSSGGTTESDDGASPTGTP